jgi:hypothetical protein
MALSKPRKTKAVCLNTLKRVLLSAAVAHEGGIACLDLDDSGKARPGAVDTNLRPVGLFIDVGESGLTGDGTKTVLIRLFREVRCWWFKNDTTDAVTDAMVGGLCYVFDDETVSSDATGTSVAGRIWAVDATKGVLVELGAA